jgi:hypothetical protein
LLAVFAFCDLLINDSAEAVNSGDEKYNASATPTTN